MEKKDVHDQIIVNQLAGMSLEEAVFQTGYTAGIEFQLGQPAQGAVWVKASERLPDHHNAVIIRYDGKVAYASKNYDKPNAQMFYVEYGGKGVLTNDVEWLDESATLTKIILNLFQQINLSDIDAPAFAHTTQFREHFDYIKRKLIEIIGTGSVTTKERDEIELSAFFQEGAECWKLEYEMCRKLLQELVDLKNIKETEGKTEDYNLRQPVAWINAKKFLEKFQHINW